MLLMEKRGVTWIFTCLKHFPKYFYTVETSVIFLQHNSNRFIYYLEMETYNLSILCSLDFIIVLCLLSHTLCVFTRFNLRVFVYLPFAASAYAYILVCVRTHLSIHVHVHTGNTGFRLCIFY